jgi:hypothetical protein
MTKTHPSAWRCNAFHLLSGIWALSNWSFPRSAPHRAWQSYALLGVTIHAGDYVTCISRLGERSWTRAHTDQMPWGKPNGVDLNQPCPVSDIAGEQLRKYMKLLHIPIEIGFF